MKIGGPAYRIGVGGGAGSALGSDAKLGLLLGALCLKNLGVFIIEAP